MTPVYPSPTPPSITEHAPDAGAMRPGDLIDRSLASPHYRAYTPGENAELDALAASAKALSLRRGEIVELEPDERIENGVIVRIRPGPLFTSAMSFADAGTFALLTAVVLSAILIIGTCERDSDVRSTSCAIRWRHAVTVQDSLIVAGHCGSDGLARGAKP